MVAAASVLTVLCLGCSVLTVLYLGTPVHSKNILIIICLRIVKAHPSITERGMLTGKLHVTCDVRLQVLEYQICPYITMYMCLSFWLVEVTIGVVKTYGCDKDCPMLSQQTLIMQGCVAIA